MEAFIAIFLPYALLLARISAFFAVLPVFGWQTVPMTVRAGIALVVTVFFAYHATPTFGPMQAHWLSAVVLLVGEVICGLALGLAANFVFLAVQQGGHIIVQQMGFAESGIIDPTTGEETETLAVLLETAFVVLFLAAGGHHVLLTVLSASYRMFPVGQGPDTGALAGGLVAAGSTMLLFALKLAAPALAAFLILAVVLAVVARVLPDMNVLLESFPLRVALGLFIAAAIMPSLNSFVTDLTDWMSRFLIA
jgi:flagellar biosynthetic protein FliR